MGTDGEGSIGQPPLVVRYEDESLLVLDKPAGVHTAPLRPGEPDTFLGMVIRSFPEVGGLPGMKAVEPGLVHRLDRETSGLVVVARSPEAFEALRAQFISGGARKGYAAACACAEQGPGAGTSLRIESRFAPFGPGRRMVRVVMPGEGSPRMLKEASAAAYATEARIDGRRGGRALLAATIHRGFRHQVRAHLAFLGYRIFGDPLYGTAVPAGFPVRMYLHAARIEMRHPSTGAALVVDSPVPRDFEALVAEERA